MSVKFIGYALMDNRGDLNLSDDGNLVFDEPNRKGDLLNLIACIDAERTEFLPHKIVRVLIDDEVGND